MDKLKLFELANEKLENDIDHMAFYLKRYQESENLSKEHICKDLHCSIIEFYKLALCKAPMVDDSDFVNRLNRISQYTGVSQFGISKIIKRVNAINQLSGSIGDAYLAAARDKKSNENSDHDS